MNFLRSVYPNIWYNLFWFGMSVTVVAIFSEQHDPFGVIVGAVLTILWGLVCVAHVLGREC